MSTTVSVAANIIPEALFCLSLSAASLWQYTTQHYTVLLWCGEEVYSNNNTLVHIWIFVWKCVRRGNVCVCVCLNDISCEWQDHVLYYEFYCV